MNCKQGDLAVLVRSTCGNEGRIVRCVAPFTGTFVDIRTGLGGKDLGPAWLIEPHLPGFNNTISKACPDSRLRPIRDPGDDAVDEMVKLVGAPREVAA